jgi:hypothetical protein
MSRECPQYRLWLPGIVTNERPTSPGRRKDPHSIPLFHLNSGFSKEKLHGPAAAASRPPETVAAPPIASLSFGLAPELFCAAGLVNHSYAP